MTSGVQGAKYLDVAMSHCIDSYQATRCLAVLCNHYSLPWLPIVSGLQGLTHGTGQLNVDDLQCSRNPGGVDFQEFWHRSNQDCICLVSSGIL